jgi:non-ribosomal peptide synthetase component F
MFGAGAKLVIVPEEYYVFPAKLIDFLNQLQVNFVFWVPFVLVNIANYKLLEQKQPKYLKKILFAGEVMPNKHLNYWRKHLPNCLYANLYGPTEITVDCTYYIVDRKFSDEESLPIGKACRNSGILIFNANDREAAVNEQGELCVRGSSLALGYYNDPEKTSKSFVQNPLNKHYPEVIYRTGDIVYRNDRNEIIYVGRKDFQIKHSGYRIELGEIENAALGTGLLKTVCVVYDTNNKEIILFYQDETELNVREFRKKILQFVPKYMVPVKYYRLDEMPLSANGKIDRLKLQKQINCLG